MKFLIELNLIEFLVELKSLFETISKFDQKLEINSNKIDLVYDYATCICDGYIKFNIQVSA